MFFTHDHLPPHTISAYNDTILNLSGRIRFVNQINIVTIVSITHPLFSLSLYHLPSIHSLHSLSLSITYPYLLPSLSQSLISIQFIPLSLSITYTYSLSPSLSVTLVTLSLNHLPLLTLSYSLSLFLCFIVFFFVFISNNIIWILPPLQSNFFHPPTSFLLHISTPHHCSHHPIWLSPFKFVL